MSPTCKKHQVCVFEVLPRPPPRSVVKLFSGLAERLEVALKDSERGIPWVGWVGLGGWAGDSCVVMDLLCPVVFQLSTFCSVSGFFFTHARTHMQTHELFQSATKPTPIFAAVHANEAQEEGGRYVG